MHDKEAVAALSALALETRLRALRTLIEAGADGLPAGEVARRLHVAQNTSSDNLHILARAGLASSRRSSRSVVYRAEEDAIRNLIRFLEALIGR